MTSLLLPQPKDFWKPEHYTKPNTNFTRGEEVIDFSELFLTATRGFKKNQPLELTDWQQWLINSILEEKENGLLRYRTVLVGLPRKNGKSLLATLLALHALTTSTGGDQIYSAAKDRPQAKIVFDEARLQVLRNPHLLNKIKVYKDVLENKSNGSIYRALSADAQSAQGLGGSLIIADELHAWGSVSGSSRGDEMWSALKEGSGDRPESLLVGITTAGGNQSSLLGKLYQHGKKVASGEIEDDSFGFFWWEAGESDDPFDPETWRKANPNLAEGLMDETDFESSIKMAGSINFTEFQRYRLNQWVQLSGEGFISTYHWELAENKEGTIKLGSEVVCGFDGSLTGDSTAIVIMDLKTGVFKIHRLWEDDGKDPNWVVDRTEVLEEFHKLFSLYDVKLVWADDSYYSQDIYKLSKQYQNRIHRIPQNAYRIKPLAEDFIQDIVSGEITHCGEEPMTRHVLNALAKADGTYMKENKKSRNKIDLLAASVMANGARNFINKKESRNSGSALILK
jgi:phage terminase large subunit-like protein